MSLQKYTDGNKQKLVYIEDKNIWVKLEALMLLCFEVKCSAIPCALYFVKMLTNHEKYHDSDTERTVKSLDNGTPTS